MPLTGGAADWPMETWLASRLMLLLIKGLLILIVAEILLLWARKSSASVRHLVRTSSLAALLLLPVLSLSGPEWGLDWLPVQSAVSQSHDTGVTESVPTRSPTSNPIAVPSPGAAEVAPQGGALPSAVVDPATASRMDAAGASLAPAASGDPRLHWGWLLLGLWGLGAVLLALRLLLGFLCVWKAKRRARPVDDGLWVDLTASAASRLGMYRPVQLLIGRDVEVALSVGLFEAAILLPEVARTWSLPRRRSILLHELAHVKRRDNLSNLVGQLACILHWPNPLVWLAARGLVVEREQACDDEVLVAGATPSEYASHLLEIARAVARRHFWGRLEISQSSALKQRFAALLNPRLARSIPGTGGKLLAVAVSTLLVLPLAAVRPWKTPAADAPAPKLAVTKSAGFVAQRSILPAVGETTISDSGSFTDAGGDPDFGEALIAGASRPGRPAARYHRNPSLPTDEDVADRRAWPLTRVITSGSHLPPLTVALWAQGPPHRIWGVGGVDSEGESPPETRARPAARLLGGNRVSRTPQEPGTSGPIQPPPGQAQVRVEIERVELGTLGGTESRALDINESGAVVGQGKLASGLEHPFLWSRETGMVDLGPALQTHTRALQVNNAGRVLCETFNARVFRGYLWNLESGLTDLGAFSPKHPFTVPAALSERGHVAGGSRDDSGMLRAFLWTPDEGMLDLGTPDWSEALALNEFDQVVGYAGAQAFVWDRVHGLSLISPPGSNLSVATDVNNRGQVVGYADFGGGFPQAFIWSRESGAVPLGAVGPEYPISFALSVDEQGHVLGRSVTVPREGVSEEVRLFRWTPETGIQDLGPLADQDQLAVNALGQIVAAYSDGSEETERSLAVIWTEDGSITLDLDQGDATHTESEVAAVNNRGQLVGSSLNLDLQRRATLWDVRIVRQ